ncbi:ShlB/FhaC/HecB family hemolysin secretion/activation protein [Methyloversatilis sp.]|uniref:ShlB/FhaC/HecB family hemolysin secretion/activation protein n=1 Tax=Methyloversatilis sp. TaxID=2569862 RepID=UPI0035B1FE25
MTQSLLCACAALLVADAARAEESADGPRFEVRSYSLAGGTVFRPSEVEALLAPYTGAEVGFGQIEAARAALQTAYHQRGFGAAQVGIPEQELSGGTVILEVLEPRLSEVTVQGARHHDEQNIRGSLPGLADGRMPNTTEVARQLSLANENSSKQTEVTFKSGRKPGEIGATISVADDNPLRRFVTVDNSGTPATGTHRVAVGLQHANLFNRDHVATFQYTTSIEKPSEVTIFGLGYRIPLYASGDSIDLTGGFSSVSSGQVQVLNSTATVSGSGRIFGLRYNWHLPREGELSQRVSLSADWRDFDSSFLLEGTSESLVPRVITHPITLSWSGNWRSDVREAGINLSLSRNIPGGEHGGSAAFEASRQGASPRFAVVRAGASWLQLLPRDWRLRLQAQGQYTNDALVSGEQFGIGGADSLRGLRERVLADDKGWRLSADVDTPAWIHDTLIMRGVLFADGAHLYRVQPLPAETVSQAVFSAGVGLRVNFSTWLSGRIDYAHLINGAGKYDSGSHRVHATFSLSF